MPPLSDRHDLIVFRALAPTRQPLAEHLLVDDVLGVELAVNAVGDVLGCGAANTEHRSNRDTGRMGADQDAVEPEEWLRCENSTIDAQEIASG